MTKKCAICDHLLQEGDAVLFAGKAIYHSVPSAVTFAISDISECKGLMHVFCATKED